MFVILKGLEHVPSQRTSPFILLWNFFSGEPCFSSIVLRTSLLTVNHLDKLMKKRAKWHVLFRALFLSCLTVCIISINVQSAVRWVLDKHFSNSSYNTSKYLPTTDRLKYSSIVSMVRFAYFILQNITILVSLKSKGISSFSQISIKTL